MSNWRLHITYNNKPYGLNALVEYASAQVIRIRVHGTRSSLLLETNFPMVAAGKAKAITWKIKDGGFEVSGAQQARLFTDIIHQLEQHLEGKNNNETMAAYLQRKKPGHSI